MAINKQSAQVQASESKTMVLQLAKLSRLHEVGGPLYENTKAYRFSVEEASRKLSMTDDITGMPVWKVYRPPVEQEVTSTPDAPQIVEAAHAMKVAATAGQASPAKAQAVEIGTPEELAELGLPAPDESGTVKI